MSYRRGYGKKSFEEPIELEKTRIKVNSFNKSKYSYVDRGFYAKQIKTYLKFFEKENMKFVLFEEFICNLPNVINEIFDFLGVKRLYNIKPIQLNKNLLSIPQIDVPIKNRLLNIYISDIR